MKNNENNRRRTAVALGFEKGDDTPRILATGSNLLAEKIISAAKENDIPVHKDSALAETLSHLELGELISPELYEVVAEVLSYVDRVDAVKAKLEGKGRA